MDSNQLDLRRGRTRPQLEDGHRASGARRGNSDSTTSTSPKLIREIGEAIFGRHWQTDLADCLDVNRRTINRWLRGQDEPRPGVWQDIGALLDARVATQQALRVKLTKHIGQVG